MTIGLEITKNNSRFIFVSLLFWYLCDIFPPQFLEQFEKGKQSTHWVQQSYRATDYGMAKSSHLNQQWRWKYWQMGAMCDQIYARIDAKGTVCSNLKLPAIYVYKFDN